MRMRRTVGRQTFTQARLVFFVCKASASSRGALTTKTNARCRSWHNLDWPRPKRLLYQQEFVMTTLLPKPHEHVIATEFEGGEGVLIDIQAKRYYQLNETAMLVWRGLERNRPLTEIAGELMKDYEVGAEHALASVGRLLAELQS